jgi:hypothetical protein
VHNVKYLVMIYGNRELWESFSAEEMTTTIAAQDAFNKGFAETGELLGAYGLADVVQAQTVRVRAGLPAVTDGPYLETKEHMSSFYLLDVESHERALEIAAQIPFASFNAVEVWPVLDEAGDEM